MIVYNQVNKTFRTAMQGGKTVLRDFSLTVRQGEVFGLLGANGAGKSTVIKLLLDFIRPDSGTITIRNFSTHESAARRDLGYLPENPYFYLHLSGWETLRFCGRASGVATADINHQGEELFKRLRLGAAADQPVRTYSKGMTQRLGLASALIHNPDLLILDEPMSGLDSVGRHLVADLIKNLKRQGKTVFMCSHILSDIENLCDRVGIIHQTVLRYCGSISDLLTNYPDIETAFLSVIGEA